eukprot:TRINITY_DN3212_c0_g1_i1.p1 TRINITY_DN3212_c0_g1~~TRINITY_DN3212_c0_g1_i1.p1  ORF type:complete len:191 (+),score=42.25 TRINITY_DN3212_c0_g1_i1:303-875(+)
MTKTKITIGGRHFILETVPSKDSGKQDKSDVPAPVGVVEGGIAPDSGNIAQNSITNEKRERDTTKRCTSLQIRIQKKVDFGYSLWISGSTDFLGGWKPEEAKPMQWTYGDHWVLSLTDDHEPFPAFLEYKYLIKHDNEPQGNYESGDNRVIRIETKEDVSPFYILRVDDSWDSKEHQKVIVERTASENIC